MRLGDRLWEFWSVVCNFPGGKEDGCGGGEGREVGSGCVACFSRSLPYQYFGFRLKRYNFPYPFSDLGPVV